MKAPFVRSPYNYNTDQASLEAGLKCEDKTLTKQSFAQDADINEIMRRFNLTGQLPDNIKLPQYVDYEGIVDFHTAMNAVRHAQEAFDALPADIRARFHNQPQELLEFCALEENREEARKLGLLDPIKDKDRLEQIARQREAEDAARLATLHQDMRKAGWTPPATPPAKTSPEAPQEGGK